MGVTTGTALRAHTRAFRTATSLLWRSLVEDAHVELLKSSGFGDELVPLDLLALDVERDDEPQPSTRRDHNPHGAVYGLVAVRPVNMSGGVQSPARRRLLAGEARCA